MVTEHDVRSSDIYLGLLVPDQKFNHLTNATEA